MWKKVIGAFIWFLSAMIVWKYVAMLVTMKSDIAVVAGLFVAVFFIGVSFFTNCFTKFIWKRN